MAISRLLLVAREVERKSQLPASQERHLQTTCVCSKDGVSGSELHQEKERPNYTYHLHSNIGVKNRWKGIDKTFQFYLYYILSFICTVQLPSRFE